jgi:hypothetical protein
MSRIKSNKCGVIHSYDNKRSQEVSYTKGDECLPEAPMAAWFSRSLGVV